MKVNWLRLEFMKNRNNSINFEINRKTPIIVYGAARAGLREYHSLKTLNSYNVVGFIGKRADESSGSTDCQPERTRLSSWNILPLNAKGRTEKSLKVSNFNGFRFIQQALIKDKEDFI